MYQLTHDILQKQTPKHLYQEEDRHHAGTKDEYERQTSR